MSTTKVVETKTKNLLFHISQNLFKNKRLKKKLAGKSRKKSAKKRPKNKRKPTQNGQPVQLMQPPAASSETIEISTDEEQEPSYSSLNNETSIVLSSGDEDEEAAQTRIFPMLSNETTVRTAVGNRVFEVSLGQLKENLGTIRKAKKTRNAKEPANNRLSKAASIDVDVSISLLSDDEGDGSASEVE